MSGPTPYQVALSWIEKHPGTSGAAGLAKLVLSLWNSECSYSYRECIRSLDESLTALSVRLIEHFAEHGEDEELVRAGYRVHELYPRLWDAGQAMLDAEPNSSASGSAPIALKPRDSIQTNPDD